VLSCPPPPGQRRIPRDDTQLRKAVNFLRMHQGEIALVTIDLGGNDLLHLDTRGNAVYCPLEPQGVR
jgi:hypothetical protein